MAKFMHVVTVVFTILFVFMVVAALLSLLGVYSNPLINPGM
ncbi:MAG TPA: hypothetical protein VFU81_00255 [Thermomicrobiales bacterium]|jgi:hypothetical protein|nr:hypothetical protein [Thermomicrobiales bacterium]